MIEAEVTVPSSEIIIEVTPTGARGPQGAQGEQGPAGATGPAGAQGPTGAQGPKGDTGDTGPAGATGPQGATGRAGADGETGPQGEQGPVGPQGPAGPTGPQGETGDTGPQGPAGPTGADGSPGAPGADGKTIRNGSGAPGGGLGFDGDFYIDTTADAIYGPKTAGAWGSPTPLVGPQGPAGADGAGAAPTIIESAWDFNATPDSWSATVGTKLTIPTHVTPTGGQTTHPSVVFVPGGWNGYQYWMAHTPYPSSNDDHEDPNICASHDGITWVVPVGLTNPIDDAGGTPEYNSDVDLILGPDDALYLFWRFYNSAATGAEETLFMSRSTDGVTWSTKEAVYQTDQTVRRLVSPTFVYEDSGLTMWAVDIVPSPNKMVQLRAEVSDIADLTAADWSVPTDCTISYMEAGKEPWHVEVRRIGGRFVALLTNCTTGASGTNGRIFMMVSADGITWTSTTSTGFIPASYPGEHDALYRATFIPEVLDGVLGLRIWYSAWLTSGPTWNTYRTFARVTASVDSDEGSSSISMNDANWSTISTNTIVKKNGWAILRFNGTRSVSTLAVGGIIGTVPVGYRTTLKNVWARDFVGNVPVYYDAANNAIKVNQSVASGTALAFSLVFDING
jgi:hypothetical protein